MNTAARLEAAAPVNGILVSAKTFEATMAAIEYAEAAPIEAKGKVEPLAVWEATTARGAVGADRPHSSPFVGRTRELELLAGALGRTREERQPELVTLVGVPGIGKSRLLHELSAIVGRRLVLAPRPVPALRRWCDLLGAWRDREDVSRRARDG